MPSPAPGWGVPEAVDLHTTAAEFSRDGPEDAQKLQFYSSGPKQELYSSLTTQLEDFHLNEQRRKPISLELAITSVAIQ